MSTLKYNEKIYLEDIFGMGGGYVLDFTNSSFSDFFDDQGINIYDEKYAIYGDSKAKRLRAFWDIEADPKVATVLEGLLSHHESTCDLYGGKSNEKILKKCYEIVARLSGKKPAINSTTKNEDDFLNREFSPDISSLPIEELVKKIIEDRLAEAKKAFNAGAYLSVIFLCGSILEGALLGVAQNNPKKFNQSEISPKDNNGNALKFDKWTLAQFINVAHKIGILSLDVKEYSHSLRYFRNYIHLYEQMRLDFIPNERTTKICLHVLSAALADLSGKRN